MKKKILFMFAAVLAIVSLSSAAETAKPSEDSVKTEAQTAVEEAPAQDAVSQAVVAEKAETSSAVASKVEAETDVKADAKKSSKHSLTRQEIRNMPLLERPNRPGHFYGNTVRRMRGRR